MSEFKKLGVPRDKNDICDVCGGHLDKNLKCPDCKVKTGSTKKEIKKDGS